MKNTTISLDEKTLEDARKYAEQMGYSFNAWVSKIIREATKRPAEACMRELMATADRIAGDSQGRSWSRDDLYER